MITRRTTPFLITDQGSQIINAVVVEGESEDMVRVIFEMRTDCCEADGLSSDSAPEIVIYGDGTHTWVSLLEFPGWRVDMVQSGKHTITVLLMKE